MTIDSVQEYNLPISAMGAPLGVRSVGGRHSLYVECKDNPQALVVPSGEMKGEGLGWPDRDELREIQGVDVFSLAEGSEMLFSTITIPLPLCSAAVFSSFTLLFTVLTRWSTWTVLEVVKVLIL